MRSITIAAMAATLMLAAPARAQSINCSGIAAPAQRLECYDRQRLAPAAPRQATPPTQAGDSQSCTSAAPCIGPRGGRYYYTATGAKRYVGR